MEYFLTTVYHKHSNFEISPGADYMKKKKLFHATVLCVLFCLTVLMTVASEASTRMPTFALESVRDGKIIKSDSFQGKVLLLTFFATWCPPCAEEVPVLRKLHNELEGAGFSVVGLSVDQQGAAVVAKFIEKQDITYPVLLAEAQTTIDFGGVYGIPVAFLVNKSGNVVKKYTGYIQHDILEKDIRGLLN
ncbi:TlpA family protein disulfide reductase [Desulfopila sp. IMCC35006]|nr:TlpA family protein disulfide reductase [Desulfopila sp. IMCC35006]